MKSRVLFLVLSLNFIAFAAHSQGLEGAKLRSPAAVWTPNKIRKEWNFTPADYTALKAKGGDLVFSERSLAFPESLRNSLMGVLRFVLDENTEPSSTAGINRVDFYHGHLICVAKGTAAQEWGRKLEADRANAFASVGLKWFEAPTKKNFRLWAKVTDVLDRSAGAVVSEMIETGLCNNALLQFHTFEYNHDEHGVGLHNMRRHLSMRLGDQTYQVLREDEEAPKDPIEILDLRLKLGTPVLFDDASIAQQEVQTSYMFNFGFLIDRAGVIHMTEGSQLGLHRFTGVKP